MIDYSCICATGKVRRNNEDNFCCDSKIREDVFSNDETVISGEIDSDSNELFAVFDGMGGEACGEVASFIAASRSRIFIKDKKEKGEYLSELAEYLNEQIREETLSRSLVLMGTTAAMLQINGDELFILNAGDSRIYKLTGGQLSQISRDHNSPAYGGKAITKFLGMPEGYLLSPYTAKDEYKSGDIFLLCSDGVTDMLSDSEIEAILSENKPADRLCRSLVDAALDKGGIDNTTAIVLKVK